MVAARCSLVVLLGCATDVVEPTTLLITDYRSSAIARYDGATGELVDVLAGMDRPASISLGPDGLYYAAGFGRGDIVRYDEAGTRMGVFYWDTQLLEEPMELGFHGNELYVLGNDTKNIVVIAADGHAMRELGFPTMRGAQDFVIDGDQILVSTESHPELGSAIQVWDRAGGTLLRHFGAYDELAFASGLALHAGVLYVCDFERSRVLRFDPESGASLGVLVDAHLQLPVELGIAPDGRLYVLDSIGLHAFDRETGAFQRTLVAVDGDVLQRPLGFIFVEQ